jgi:heme exporter protein D
MLAAAQSNWAYVVAGYAISVAALGGYAVRVVVRHRRLRAEAARESE